jgi:hypothetical protein
VATANAAERFLKWRKYSVARALSAPPRVLPLTFPQLLLLHRFFQDYGASVASFSLKQHENSYCLYQTTGI